MVLWFKKLFKRKKKNSIQHLLSFNAEELGSHMQNLQVEMFRCRQDEAVKVIQAILLTARNIQIIEINRFKSGEKLSQLEHQLGRLEVLNDLVNFISSSLDPDVYNERKAKETTKKKVLRTNFERSQAVI